MKLDRDALAYAAETAYYVLGHGRRVYCTRQDPSPDWTGLSPDQQAMLRQHASWVVGAYLEFLSERGGRERRRITQTPVRGATPRPRSKPRPKSRPRRRAPRPVEPELAL